MQTLLSFRLLNRCSSAINLYTTMWLSVMQRYLLLNQQGIINFAVRYEDLVTESQQIVASIFEYCDLPISQVDRVCQVFSEDAHSSSTLSRENLDQQELKVPDIKEIKQKTARLLKKHPQINTPDFAVPGTLEIFR